MPDTTDPTRLHGLADWLRAQAAQSASAPWHNDPFVRQHIDALNSWAREVDEARAALSAAPPTDLHPRTADLVDRFAAALKEKLAAAEKKYGYSDGWAEPGWMQECRAKLMDHVAKGDPRDVAAYCAFMWHHGWPTSLHVSADFHP